MIYNNSNLNRNPDDNKTVNFHNFTSNSVIYKKNKSHERKIKSFNSDLIERIGKIDTSKLNCKISNMNNGS